MLLDNLNPNMLASTTITIGEKDVKLDVLVDEYSKTHKLGEYYDSEDAGPTGVPFGTTSFADLKAAQVAGEKAEDVDETIREFQALVNNIMWSSEVPNKIVALRRLVTELQTELAVDMSDEMTEGDEDMPTVDEVVEAVLQRIAEKEVTPPEPEIITKLEESASDVQIISENDATGAPIIGGPLRMKVRLIRPGFGNKKDGHYYSPEMLKRDASVFIGAKMHESEHDDKGKTNRTWVSTVTDILEFDEDGAPIAEVVCHQPDFITACRNLQAGNVLDKLQCSIQAEGVVKKGKVNGVDAKIVERIVSRQDIDWVNRAGAGGQAVSIAESEVEEPKTEAVTMLDKDTVISELGKTNLPEATQNRIKESEYETIEKLQESIEGERAYLASVTKIGKVTDMAGGPVSKPAPTKESIAESQDAILAKYGLGR